MIFSLRPRNLSGFISMGSGPVLRGTGPDDDGECPLVDTRVKASLSGPFAEVRMTQLYLNGSDRAIEFQYTFPMPHDSAVTGFELRIGGRVVEGVVRESLGARADFAEAIAAGHRGALLEQDRQNVFTLTVGRVLPGEKVEIGVKYVQVLLYRSGNFTFRLPLVVAPRYIPGIPETYRLADGKPSLQGAGVPWGTDQVPDAARFVPPRGTGLHGVSIELEVRPGLPVDDWSCPTHEVKFRSLDDGVMHVTTVPGESPDRDFVFRYHVGGDSMRLGLVAHRPDPKMPGTFCLFAIPPEEIGPRDVCAREIVFVLDRSGSMGGEKMQQAKEAVRGFLRGLNPWDRFGIVAFGSDLQLLHPALMDFSESNLQEAEMFLGRIQADGGTDLLPALDAALAFGSLEKLARHVIVITDGHVANEEEILLRVKSMESRIKIHAFGIDTCVNDLLIHQLARFGRGVSRLVLPSQDIEGEIADLAASLVSPLLANPVVRFQVEKPITCSPRTPPDLGAGDVLVVAGTYTTSGRIPVSICGTGHDGVREITGEVELPERTNEAPEVPAIRARLHLMDLEQVLLCDPEDHATRRRLIKLSVSQGLLSSCTSFVAIDPEAPRALTDSSIFVQVPVEFPKSWQLLSRPKLTPATRSPWDPGRLNFVGGGLLGGFLRMFSGGPSGEAPAADPAEASGTLLAGAERLAAIECLARLDPHRGPDVTLRTLAKRQHASGAWPDGLRGTAEAVITMISAGHTDRDGTYAGQLRRAVSWLEEQAAADAPHLDEDLALAVRALELLARVTGSRRHRDLARRFATLRPAPGLDMERGVEGGTSWIT